MAREFFEAIDGCNPNQENRTLTVIDGDGYGEKAVLAGGGVSYLSDGAGFLAAHRGELFSLEPGIQELAGSSVYVERIGTAKKVVICGAGHVSLPIVKIAKMAGFHVTVLDDRAVFAERGREAGADVVFCEPFEEALAKIPGDGDTFFVIVTRGHQFDTECLRAILRKPRAYLGMMGSARRVRLVKEQLVNEGADPEGVGSLHSPIGLSIGAQTPEEIAVSIMAEVIQEKNRTAGGAAAFPPELLRDILGTAHTEPLPGRKALCTIVSRKGPAPREVGAKMLITSEGKSLGTIGGGCTEAGVFQAAGAMLQEPAPVPPVLLRASLTAGEAADEGEACGGVIEVWIEEI